MNPLGRNIYQLEALSRKTPQYIYQSWHPHNSFQLLNICLRGQEPLPEREVCRKSIFSHTIFCICNSLWLETEHTQIHTNTLCTMVNPSHFMSSRFPSKLSVSFKFNGKHRFPCVWRLMQSFLIQLIAWLSFVGLRCAGRHETSSQNVRWSSSCNRWLSHSSFVPVNEWT